jgi:hypothetical protein
MLKRCRWIVVRGLLVASLVSCPAVLRARQKATGDPGVSSGALAAKATAPPVDSHWTDRIWMVTKAPSTPAKGSIYIFLANGTLLESSCVQNYRVAMWKEDRNSPSIVHVTEDGRPAFTADVKMLSPQRLEMEQRFAHSQARRNIELIAINGEYTCSGTP